MKIKIYPDPALRKNAAAVRRVAPADIDKLHSMLELMYRSDGIGLAGTQVGWNVRVIVMDADGSREGERIFINPRIINSRGLEENEEGCLSLPGIRSLVPRAGSVIVTAYTLAGEKLELEAEGLHARVWQHEIDHLNGVLFIDRIAPSERFAMRHRLKSLEERVEGPVQKA